MENKNSNIIYFNLKEGYGVDHKLIKEGWEVVNARLPLPGKIIWRGKFRHGDYYAAGSREEFGRMWYYLNAYPCKLISNEEIIEQAKEFCRKHDKTIESCGLRVEKLAEMLHLPFIID